MIYQIVSHDNDDTMDSIIEHWSPGFGKRWQILHPQQLAGKSTLPVGTYVFTDLERQNPGQLAIQAQAYAQLKAAGVRVLNDPSKALGRHDLLKTLHQRGINSFRAFRTSDVPSDLRFPVFIRTENNHSGSYTQLLDSWQDWEDAMIQLILSGGDPNTLLTTEFCDTVLDDGVYAMYTSYRIADRIVPRHVYFGRDWMVKGADVSPQWRMEEKWDFLRRNPYADELMEIFELANIEYGRADFGLLDGKVQIWEINLNPGYSTGPVTKYPVEHREMHQYGADILVDALTAIDTPNSKERVPINLYLPRRPQVTSR